MITLVLSFPYATSSADDFEALARWVDEQPREEATIVCKHEALGWCTGCRWAGNPMAGVIPGDS